MIWVILPMKRSSASSSLEFAFQVLDRAGVDVEVVADEFPGNLPDLLVLETVEDDIYQDAHVLLVEEELLYSEEGGDQRPVVGVQVHALDHADLVALDLVEKVLYKATYSSSRVGK